ncbi:MAG: RNA polymerase sigma factor [Victivallales bacterium]|nr:RNA polymerase sigma factor [Victivallales bacterium]
MNEDGEAVKAILGGDKDRYAELMERHKDMVCAIVGRRIPGNDAGEMVQEVFVRAYHSLPGFAGTSPFRNWLSRIAVRTCCDYWRKHEKRKVQITAPGPEEQQWLEAISHSVSQERFERDRSRKGAAELLEWTLTRLKGDDRTLIELIYFEDQPLKEVAAYFKWGLPKTKIRAMRARQKMKKIIQSLMEKS